MGIPDPLIIQIQQQQALSQQQASARRKLPPKPQPAVAQGRDPATGQTCLAIGNGAGRGYKNFNAGLPAGAIVPYAKAPGQNGVVLHGENLAPAPILRQATQSPLVQEIGILFRLSSSGEALASLPPIPGFSASSFPGFSKSFTSSGLWVGGYSDPIPVIGQFSLATTIRSPDFQGDLIAGEYGDFVDFTGFYQFSESFAFRVDLPFKLSARVTSNCFPEKVSLTINGDLYQKSDFESFDSPLTVDLSAGDYEVSVAFEVSSTRVIDYLQPEDLITWFLAGLTIETDSVPGQGGLLSAGRRRYFVSTLDGYYSGYRSLEVAVPDQADWRVNPPACLSAYLEDNQGNYYGGKYYRVPDDAWAAYTPTNTTIEVEVFQIDGDCNFTTTGIKPFRVQPLPADAEVIGVAPVRFR